MKKLTPLLILLLLSGCFQSKEHLIINNDGSGTFKSHIVVPKTVANLIDSIMGEFAKSMSEAFGQKEAKAPKSVAEEMVGSKDDILKKAKAYVTHNVAAGDNLYLLSAYYYGNARQWKKIFDENRDVIKNPNVLDIGVKLKIPVEADWSPKYSIEEFRKMIKTD